MTKTATGSRSPEAAATAGTRGQGRRLVPVLVPVLIFAALAGLFALALQKGDPSKLPSTMIGRPVPNFVLAPVEGLAGISGPMPGFSSADLGHGKPAIINFFASWCIPCAEEHPQLVALAKRTGVTLYGINHKDEPGNALRFLSRHGNPYAAVGADRNGRASIEWGVYGMPETFVVDGQGKVVFKHVGPITAQSMASQMLPALRRAGWSEPR